MTEIALESITKKLGFDPMNPPYPEAEPQVVNDNRPSLWAPLTEEELAFLIEIDTGINVLKRDDPDLIKKAVNNDCSGTG